MWNKTKLLDSDIQSLLMLERLRLPQYMPVSKATALYLDKQL